MTADPNVAESSGVARLVDRIKPYKELAAAGVGVIAMLSGAVSWAVAHFATQEELKRLECTSEVNLATRALPLFSAVLSVKIETKWAQLAETRKTSSPEAEIRGRQLEADIRDLSDERKATDLKYQLAVETAPVKCRVGQ